MKSLAFLLAASLAASITAHAEDIESFAVHVQSTYVRQEQPAFASPYEGRHSLGGDRAWGYSFTATAAVGARFGSAEAYVDAEVA